MAALPVPPPEFSGLLSTAEVANVLGVAKRHIYRLVSEDRIPYLKWGRLLRFDPAEIAAWLEGFRRSAGGKQPWA
jgi:excisionase family DNA binding protein